MKRIGIGLLVSLALVFHAGAAEGELPTETVYTVPNAVVSP